MVSNFQCQNTKPRYSSQLQLLILPQIIPGQQFLLRQPALLLQVLSLGFLAFFPKQSQLEFELLLSLHPFPAPDFEHALQISFPVVVHQNIVLILIENTLSYGAVEFGLWLCLVGDNELAEVKIKLLVING